MTRTLRLWHRWISIVVALPFLITIATGLLLVSRGFNPWVQPSYEPINAGLTVSFDQVLEAVKSVPEMQVKEWKDVSQIDIRPADGNIRVRSKVVLWETQINGSTGQVTGHGPRRFSLLVALHEGAYFGPYVRYGIFLPSALGVFFLLISGILIVIKPYFPKQFSHKDRYS